MSMAMMPNEDLATMTDTATEPVATAQPTAEEMRAGIIKSLSQADPATRAEALKGLGEGFFGTETFGQLSSIKPSGDGSTGTGTGTGQTEAERIARLDREAAAALAANETRQRQTDAFSRLRALLSRVGLTDLEGTVRDIITGGSVDLNDSSAILFAIRDQPAYQKRFAGNAARSNPNRIGGPLAELDPATYLGLEDAYRELMQSNGLPTGFYDQTSDFQKFIEGNTSPQELQARIEQGYRRVQDADPEVRRQMRELYGVDDNSLVAYFLDTERAEPLLLRQAKAAQVAARAREQGGMQLGAATAEDLIARGYTPEEAQQAFTQAGQLAGLYQEMGGEQGLTEQQKVGAAFGYDVQAQKTLERRKAQRIGEFQAGGQFARTTGSTSGAIETGVGKAQ